MRCIFLLAVILLLTPLTSAIVINEFTTDPQTDWDGNGAVSNDKDEWFELFNDENLTIDLTNWTLVLNDSSDEFHRLSGTIKANSYFTILNPQGSQINDGQLILLDNANNVIDSVSYGKWNDTNSLDNAPDGNANDKYDECLARIPNGHDTNSDINDWQKTRCTYGSENGITPPNEQDLNVTITGMVVFKILPRNLEFGFVQPGSQNNPATNGPIMLDATGSTADAMIAVTNVFGFPFEEGLKFDGQLAFGQSWTIHQNDPILEITPTLDIPEDAPAGNNRGTITYTISGLPPQ